MGQDKKVRDGRIAFVLARDIGEAFVARDVDLARGARRSSPRRSRRAQLIRSRYCELIACHRRRLRLQLVNLIEVNAGKAPVNVYGVLGAAG